MSRARFYWFFLRFLKVVSGYSRIVASSSESLLEKRRTYLRTFVKLIAVFSSRHKASLQSKESDFNRVLSAQLTHLEATVEEEAELQILLTELLAVLNLSHLDKINENCLTLWIKNRTGDGLMIKTFIKILPEVCVNCDLAAVLLESCITAYFENRSSSFPGASWTEITEILNPYPPRLTELERVLVSRACVLTLHALLEQRALKHLDPIDIMQTALNWLEEIKIRYTK